MDMLIYVSEVNLGNKIHISFEREMTILKELAAGNKGVRNYDVDIICIGF